jgi:hypothetical protein
MNHINILKRAWNIVWSYRVLWVFGIILALTTGGNNWSFPNNNAGDGPVQWNIERDDFFKDFDEDWEEFFRDLERDLERDFERDFGIPDFFSLGIVSTLIFVGLSLACVILIMSIVGTIARYVAETALIRMVDEYEETGEKRGLRQGLRMGWSRTALRLFLINLLIDLPLAMVFILLFLLTLAPLLLWITKSMAAGVIGTVATTGLFFLLIFLAILIGVTLRLLKRFFWRACALERLGVIDSIRRGFDIVKRHWQDVLVMWLIMVGVSIGWAIAMVLGIILLLPAIILLIVVGIIVGGIPALLVFGLTSLFFGGAVPWILAAMIGIPISALVVAVPGLFLAGLMEVFKSSVWTLTYRELRALERVEPAFEQLPEPDEPKSD